MRILLALALGLGWGRVGVAQEAFALISPATVAALPAQKDTDAGKALIREAEAHLNDAPHAMPRLHTEGTLPHQGIRDESIAAERDFPIAEATAFAYGMTGDAKYLAQVSRVMDAWASVYKVSGNPIDETILEPLFVAFDLTRGKLDAGVEARMLKLSRAMAETYMGWLTASGDKDPFNFSSHRVKLAVLGADETGDAKMMARAGELFRAQVARNVRADGSVQDFYKRDALHYVVYDLEPLEVAALAAKAHGQDWFESGQPSLALGVRWLVPYAAGVKTHEEFQNSTVGFDAARAKAGEAGYSGVWDPKTSVRLLGMATWLDQRFHPVLARVEETTGARVQPWIVVGMAAAP